MLPKGRQECKESSKSLGLAYAHYGIQDSQSGSSAQHRDAAQCSVIPYIGRDSGEGERVYACSWSTLLSTGHKANPGNKLSSNTILKRKTMTPPPFNTSPFLQELFRPLCLLSSPLTGDLFQLQLWTLQELRTWGVTLTYSEFSEDGYITPLISSTQLTGFSLWCHALQINSPWIPLQLVLENLFQPSNNKQRKKNCYFLVLNYQCMCVCTPIVHQAPLSMKFSRQEHWNVLPFPSPGNLPDWVVKPMSLTSPALVGRFFTT